MNIRDEQDFRVLYRRFIQLGRWFLLLVCLSAGGFLLLMGKSKGFGFLLLLAGFWLILDNPLESLEVLAGSCPFCGHEIRIGRREKFSCPACDKSITVHPYVSDQEDSWSINNLASGVGEGGLEDLSQAEPVVIGPSDTLDLHTFSPKEVASLMDEFIRQSQKDGIGLVKIIHGKGTGALRRRVQALLARDPRVLTFYDAPRKSGGWGATVVELSPGGEDGDDQSDG